MKSQRYTKALMLVIYLMAVIAMPVASLSCHCNSLVPHDDRGHFCTVHCHHPSSSPRGENVASACLCNHHRLADEIDLYLTKDDSRQKQIPEILAATISSPFEYLPPITTCEEVITPPSLKPREKIALYQQLRAPPHKI